MRNRSTSTLQTPSSAPESSAWYQSCLQLYAHSSDRDVDYRIFTEDPSDLDRTRYATPDFVDLAANRITIKRPNFTCPQSTSTIRFAGITRKPLLRWRNEPPPDNTHNSSLDGQHTLPARRKSRRRNHDLLIAFWCPEGDVEPPRPWGLRVVSLKSDNPHGAARQCMKSQRALHH